MLKPASGGTQWFSEARIRLLFYYYYYYPIIIIIIIIIGYLSLIQYTYPGEKDVLLNVLKMYLSVFLVDLQYKYTLMHF